MLSSLLYNVLYTIQYTVLCSILYIVDWNILYNLDEHHTVQWCKPGWLIMSRTLTSLPSLKWTNNSTVEYTAIYTIYRFSVLKCQNHWLKWLIKSGTILFLFRVYGIYPYYVYYIERTGALWVDFNTLICRVNSKVHNNSAIFNTLYCLVFSIKYMKRKGSFLKRRRQFNQ